MPNEFPVEFPIHEKVRMQPRWVALLMGAVIGGLSVFVVMRTLNERPVEDKYHWPNGNKRAEGDLIGGYEHGVWTYWREDGTLDEKIEFDHGVMKGRYESYDALGRLVFRAAQDERGLFAGKSEIIDTNGHVIASHFMKDGRSNGDSLSYYPNGNVSFSGAYANDWCHGDFTEWLEDKTQFMAGSYDHGRMHGKWIIWLGKRRVEIEFDQGGLVDSQIIEQ